VIVEYNYKIFIFPYSNLISFSTATPFFVALRKIYIYAALFEDTPDLYYERKYILNFEINKGFLGVITWTIGWMAKRYEIRYLMNFKNIVGGGVVGLAVVWALKWSPHNICLYEADERFGDYVNSVSVGAGDQ
jgi:hypothetical protein